MRVLFITNRFPRPDQRGDQLRAFQQLRFLGPKHAITLISFTAPDHPPSAQVIDQVCEKVIVVRRHPIRQFCDALKFFWNGKPIQVNMFETVPDSLHLSKVLVEGKFDVVHIQMARLGALLDHVQTIPTVLDLVDALSLNMQRRASTEVAWIKWLMQIEANRLAKYESAICVKANQVAISAMPDLLAIASANIELVPNGVDLDLFSFQAKPANNQDIIFVGNLGYYPNIDAAIWFATQVMPGVLQHLPGARFCLVGARPAKRLKRLAKKLDYLDLRGAVENVHEHLTRAAIAVVPLRIGSGQQLKLIEAMAAGTPVVSSSLSAKGLDNAHAQLRNDVELLIEDEAEAMVKAVCRLMLDQNLRTRLSVAARAFVELHHDWAHSAVRLEQLWFAAKEQSR